MAIKCLHVGFWAMAIAVLGAWTPAFAQTFETYTINELSAGGELVQPEIESEVVPSERLLPGSTRLWISLPNASKLKEAFDQTQFGALTQQETLRPFVEKVSAQVKSWLDERNMELGVKTDDFAELHTGEICIAAVLPDDEVVSDYGFAIIVDVSQTQAKAKKLRARLRDELERRKAVSEEIKFGNLEVTKWTYPAPTGLRERQKFAFHLLTEDYLMVCDNQEIAREICSNIEGNAGSAILANSEMFKQVREQSQFTDSNVTSHIQFYIEPFGYFDIVQDLAERNLKAGELKNNHIRQFRESGFDAIQAVGGNVSIGGQYELLARAYVHAPSNSEDADRKYKGAGELLRFDNLEKHDLLPEAFVPAGSAGYASVAWDMQKAFANVEPLFDRIFNEGAFQDLIENVKTTGPRVDLSAFVGRIDNRVSVFTENTHPIEKTSEKIVLAFKVREDADGVFAAIERMIAEEQLTKLQVGNYTVLRDKEIEDEIPDLVFDLPDEGDDEDLPEKPKPLFDERIFVKVGDYILLGNDLAYIESLLTKIENDDLGSLAEDNEIREVNAILDQFLVGDRASLRQYFKLDESLRVHYEMIRTGQMGGSSTLLSKVLNQMMASEEESTEEVRAQKIDGSLLPSDFDSEVAPYLGNGGIIFETIPNGWLLNGVILKKNDREEVASRQQDMHK